MALAAWLSFGGWPGGPPGNLGVSHGRLAPCRSSPNCVSSDATDAAHRVAPFALESSQRAVWNEVVTIVASLSRVSVVTRTADYLHAEARSRLLRFVDDLELHLRPDDGIIAVRSASRLGRRDFGVNRRRVERLRSMLRDRGLVQ